MSRAPGRPGVPVLGLLAGAVLTAASCSTVRPSYPPASPEQAARAISRLATIRERAWEPRRFKALFSAVVSPKIGSVQRGYLSVFWDGSRLDWRTSLPVAGNLGAGALGRDGVGSGGGGLAGMLSSRLTDADALSVLFGAPSLPVQGATVEKAGEALRLLLDSEGRTVVLHSGYVIAMEFPGGVDARLEPGPEVPSRIEVRSRKGRAVLKLESAGPWPEGEPLPGVGS